MKFICTFLLIFCFSPSDALSLDGCPAALNRDVYLQVHGDYCYRFVTYRKVTHSFAKADCESQGGSLVLVKDQDTQIYLHDQLAHTYQDVFDKVWIGLNDVVIEGTYQWEDGAPLVYSHWAENEGPGSSSLLHNHETKDCVVIDMLTGGQWREIECDINTFLLLFQGSETHSYICQYRVRTPATVIIQVGQEMHTSGPGVTVVSVVNPCPAIICSLGCATNNLVVDPATGCSRCECGSK